MCASASCEVEAYSSLECALAEPPPPPVLGAADPCSVGVYGAAVIVVWFFSALGFRHGAHLLMFLL